MLGLFGTLSMANRSLQTQRAGTEVAGHNLANVNTPGYSRQRVDIDTSLAIPSEMGPQGTGADAVGINSGRAGVPWSDEQLEALLRAADARP